MTLIKRIKELWIFHREWNKKFGKPKTEFEKGIQLFVKGLCGLAKR